jgi:hypothetical protein
MFENGISFTPEQLTGIIVGMAIMALPFLTHGLVKAVQKITHFFFEEVSHFKQVESEMVNAFDRFTRTPPHFTDTYRGRYATMWHINNPTKVVYNKKEFDELKKYENPEEKRKRREADMDVMLSNRSKDNKIMLKELPPLIPLGDTNENPEPEPEPEPLSIFQRGKNYLGSFFPVITIRFNEPSPQQPRSQQPRSQQPHSQQPRPQQPNNRTTMTFSRDS